MALEFAKVGPSARMTVRIISGVVVNGRPHDVGEVVDVSAADGLLLLSQRRVEKFVAPVVEPVAIPDPAVVPESKKKGEKK